jgi:hypothetical protein
MVRKLKKKVCAMQPAALVRTRHWSVALRLPHPF